MGGYERMLHYFAAILYNFRIQSDTQNVVAIAGHARKCPKVNGLFKLNFVNSPEKIKFKFAKKLRGLAQSHRSRAELWDRLSQLIKRREP